MDEPAKAATPAPAAQAADGTARPVGPPAPAVAVVAEAGTSPETAPVAAATPAAAPSAAPAMPVPAAPPAAPASPVPAPKPATIAPPAPTQPTAPAPQPAAVVEPVATEPPENPYLPAPSRNKSIRLQFDQDAWVQIRDGNGRTLHSMLNKAGSTVDLAGKPPFDFVVGNAANVRMTYGGRPFDVKPYIGETVARFTLE
jgi:cytoskeleton protein RodZ